MQRTADSAGGDAFLKSIIIFSMILGARVRCRGRDRKSEQKTMQG